MSDEKTNMEPRTLEGLAVGTQLRGKIKSLELFGAFVDLGIGIDALLHISQITPRVKNVAELLSVGQELDVFVLKIHAETKRVALAMQRPPTVSWDDLTNGKQFTGTVTRIERFGAFVDIGCERAGMVHVSEITDGYLSAPSDMLNIGQNVDVWVLKVDRRKRQIDLTMKEPLEHTEEEDEEIEALPTAMELAFRRAMNSDGKSANDVSRREKRRNRSLEQEDIIARTLRAHSETD